MSTSADLPPIPDGPLEPLSGYMTADEIRSLEALPPAAPSATLEQIAYDPNGSLRSHVHTALALAAFVACIVVRA